jgi:hypothetical protein
MDKRIWKPLAMTLAVSAASLSHAYADVDIDNDGLIEISTLQQLDLMRYDLAGTSLNGDSTGCPATGCNGYELVADLDFDTNGNGVADEGDLFWNNGAGWVPVGDSSGGFSATFEGNNHLIRNLFMSTPVTKYIGIFGIAENAILRNLMLVNSKVSGSQYIGVLVGAANSTEFHNIHITGITLAGGRRTGALLGSGYDDIVIENVKVSGSISGSNEVGGVVGYLSENGSFNGVNGNQLSDLHFNGEVSGNLDVGALVGGLHRTDVAGFTVKNSTVSGSTNIGGAFGKLVYATSVLSGRTENVELVGSSRIGGLAGNSFNSSIHQVSIEGSVYSDYSFGSVAGGLIGYGGGLELGNIRTEVEFDSLGASGGMIGEVSYRFGAQIEDSLDLTRSIGAGEHTPFVAISSDTTTVIDSFWDSELSSQVNGAWGESRTTTELQCPTMPGDVMCDASLYSGWDATIWDFGTLNDYPVLFFDKDGDSINDIYDVDIDNDGLIEISTLEQLDLMRYDLAGTSLNGDSTGCPATGCHGYELVADLDFDTNGNGNGVADEGDLFWNNGTGWMPVGSGSEGFSAVLEGNNHIVRNLFMSTPVTKYIGIFGIAENAILRNLMLVNSKVSGSQYIGVLVGAANSTEFHNIHITGITLAGGRRTGALLGSGYDDIVIENVKVSGSISGSNEVGGVVGYLSENGSFNGVNGNQLSDLHFNGEVSGNLDVGALVGGLHRTDVAGFTVKNSTVSGSTNIGGAFGKLVYATSVLSGRTENVELVGSSRIGGLAGNSFNSSIHQVSIEGSVYSDYSFGSVAGGLIGYGGGLELGNIRTEVEFDSLGASGGMIGEVSYRFGAQIEDSLDLTRSIGAGEHTPFVAISSDTTTVIDSFWDSELSSQVNGAWGESRTTTELQCPTMPGDVMCDASLYSGWDATIWDFGTSTDYPVLR